MTVTGPGSSWINGTGPDGFNIGSSGTGKLIIENGGMVVNENPNSVANIARQEGSVGMVTITGPGSIWSNVTGVNIGNRGAGALTIADGGVLDAPAVVIAANAVAGSIGTLNIGAGPGNPAAAPGTLTRRPSHLAPEPVRSTSITHPPTTCLRLRSAAMALSMCLRAPPCSQAPTPTAARRMSTRALCEQAR